MSRISNSFQRLFGFSITEVMITLLVIGTLTAIALPIYEHNITQAKMSEADAALGSIRTQLRVYSSEFGKYPTANPAGYVIGADWNDLERGDMVGRYFSDSSYKYFSLDGSNFTISCRDGSDSNSIRTINESGTLAGDI